MKKIFALTLSLTLGFALLSCGGSGGSKISEKELAGTIALMDELNVLNQLISTTVAINTSVVEENCDTSGKVILNYGDGLEIDETSFDASSLARRDWKCRMVISEEKPLKTVIDTIAQEHGLIVFEDVLGKMTCLTLDPPVESEILSGGKDISGSLTAMRSSKADFKEKFTDIEYLISELDTHYNKFDQDNYKGYIKSDDLGYQDALDKAKEFLNGNKVKVNLKLETVIDSVTASNIAILKTNYHFMPTRIITVGCIFDTSAWNLGMWVTCSSEVIGETTGKVYFIIRKGVIVPFGKNRAGVSLTLLEYDADAIRLQIREVPRQSVNTNYDEVIDSDEQIEEVPDAE